MKTTVYTIWVNGRDIVQPDMHYPIDCNTVPDRGWHTDKKQAQKDFFAVKIKDSDSELGLHSEIYKDYIVVMFSIEIDTKQFENKFDLEWDINSDDVQEMIPYYVDYDFKIEGERINDFEK